MFRYRSRASPEGDKLTRFFAQASRIEAGEVVLPRSAPWRADLVAELVGFPNARHDDQADALAQLLRHPPMENTSAPVGPTVFIASELTDADFYDDDIPSELDGLY